MGEAAGGREASPHRSGGGKGKTQTGPRRGPPGKDVVKRYRWFESGSLQRRVWCEPAFRDQAPKIYQARRRGARRASQSGLDPCGGLVLPRAMRPSNLPGGHARSTRRGGFEKLTPPLEARETKASRRRGG